MPAAAVHGYDLLHIVAKQEPYLFLKRHVGLEVGEERPPVGPHIRVVMPRHGYFAPTRGRTLSIWK